MSKNNSNLARSDSATQVQDSARDRSPIAQLTRSVRRASAAAMHVLPDAISQPVEKTLDFVSEKLAGRAAGTDHGAAGQKTERESAGDVAEPSKPCEVGELGQALEKASMDKEGVRETERGGEGSR